MNIFSGAINQVTDTDKNQNNIDFNTYHKKDILIQTFGLKKQFKLPNHKCFIAFDNVTLDIYKGETFGLIGESGSGKTTFGRVLLRLYKPTAGKIIFENTDITKITSKEYKKKMQMIFQNPASNLDPKMTVKNILLEPLKLYKIGKTKYERDDIINDLLDKINMSKNYLNRYPHELSGGQQQRIAIARIISVKPEFIVCDEPLSALDITTQSQVIDVLMDIQNNLNLTYLFISHDLAVVKYIAKRVAVMYLGSIVELADSSELYNNPLHPYTKFLLNSVLALDCKNKKDIKNFFVEKQVNNFQQTNACKFYLRCPYAKKICEGTKPNLKQISQKHSVACHLLT
jgi:oligopeptide transport system ATP-binding protein